MKRLLSVNDVCELLQVSRRNLTRLIAKGQIPPPDLKLGRSNRWTPATLEDWIGNAGRVARERK
ncbi:MAG: helix-turn-helix transcriptional regulator [Phycisphaerae bacterium]